jgi:phosphate transport system substrate-binding protein
MAAWTNLLARTLFVLHMITVPTAMAEPEDFVIAGSTTLYPLSGQLVSAYRRTYGDTGISIESGGSARGIAALFEGEAQIANSSRFISDEELETARQSGIYPVPFRIADDCIIPIVNPRNRLQNLSRERLRAIFRGEVRNWRELGGPDRPIKVVTRRPDSGTFGVWRDLVMSGAEVYDAARRVDDQANMVSAVSADRDAIGYIALGYLSASIKPLRVDGVMGSLSSVRDGSYPLSRPLFMFTRGWPRGALLEFINFTLDPYRGQVIVRQAGFVPVHAGRR